MDFKTINKISYQYECTYCGNEFSKDREINPVKCYSCDEFDCFESNKVMYEVVQQLCPICNTFFETSDYLNNKIQDKHSRWIANMVTHYRHEHIKSWNRMWKSTGKYYRSGWYSDDSYEYHKSKTNESAKRQILRKCKQYMINNGFTTDHVKQLKNTDEKTIELYNKLLELNNKSSE